MPSETTPGPGRSASLLRIEDLHVSVEDQPILRGVNLTVDDIPVDAGWDV